MQLDIYKNGQVEKTYTADTYDVMYGTLEELIDVIDIDQLSSESTTVQAAAITNLISGGMKQIKPILLDVFPGLTPEELKCVKVKDLGKVLLELITYTINQIVGLDDGTGKNERRG